MSTHLRLRHVILALLAAIGGPLVAVVVGQSAQADSGVHAAGVINRAAAAADRASIASQANAVRPKLTSAGFGYVRDGLTTDLPKDATLLGAVPGTQQLAVDLALVPRNAQALAQFATDVSTPGTSDYRHYITPHQFAITYGATSAEISAVRSAMAAAGLRSAPATSNGLVIKVTGSAAQFQRAFATSLNRYRLATGRVAMANTAAPRIATSAAKYVSAVIGLSTLVQYTPQVASARITTPKRSAQAAATPAASTTPTTTTPATATSYAGGPKPCADAVKFAKANTTTIVPGTPISTMPPITSDTFNYDYFATAYDFDPLYQAGDLGQGVNVGIFELEPSFPTDPPGFENCYGINTAVSYVPVDGAEPAPSASNDDGFETSLDIDTIAALAPDSNITVYQGNENAATGWLDTFNAIVSANHDRVVSVSYGACEQLASELIGSQPQAEITIFEEAAAQGQTISASSGDAGAEGCRLKGTTVVPAVEDPSSDPYITGVGGTDLEAAGSPPATRPTEVVWNDGAALDAADEGGATGGGISTLWLMPKYQSDAPASLGVMNAESQGFEMDAGITCSGSALNGTPVVGDTAYYCREVPDVTASASPYYGYTVYYNGAWGSVGGTSGATPLWAALFADADSTPNCQADPIGFANPALYRIAATSRYSSDFNDITSGSNDEDDTNGTDFNALAGYDMASGLGSPVAANLVQDLCPTPPAKTTTTPASTTTVTTTVTTPAPATSTHHTSSATCKATSLLRFRQHPKAGIRVIKALVTINGKTVKTVKGRKILLVSVHRPKATTFRLVITSTLSDGEVIAHGITYHGCRQTKIVFKVLRKAGKRANG